MIVQRRNTMVGVGLLVSNKLENSPGILRGFKRMRETIRLRTVAARFKLKGIDGSQCKGWNMWFNSIYRAESYHSLYLI